MANKNRQTVTYRKLKLPRILPDGMLGLARPSASVAGDLERMFDSISGRAGAAANIAAKNEGSRAGAIAGAQLGFKPTNKNSLRAQAYDASGTRAYMKTLDANVRKDMHGLYEEHKDNPKQLTVALKTLQTEYENQHVFDEIKADFGAGFTALSTSYMKSSSDAAEKRRLLEDQAGMLERINTNETVLAQRMETLDLDTPAADALVSEGLTQFDNEIDEAVVAKRMSPVMAENAKQEKRRDVASRFYLKQAEGLGTAQEVADYRAQLSADFGAGKLSNVDAVAFDAINTKLKTVERARNTADKSVLRNLKKRGDAITDNLAMGVEPDPSQMTALMIDSQKTQGGVAVLEKAMNNVSIAGKLRDSSLVDGNNFVIALKADARKSRKQSDIDAAEFAQQHFNKTRSAIKSDPIGAAASRGVMEDSGGIEFNENKSAADYASDMETRLVAAETAAEHFEIPLKIFRPGEVDAIASFVKQNPAAGIAIAGGLVAGSRGNIGNVLAELGGAAPQIVQAGRIIAMGGSRQAAIDVIRGHGKDLNGKARPKIDATLRVSGENEILGASFAARRDDKTAVLGAAESIARARMADAGIDAKNIEDAKPIYHKALQEAAGATFDKGVQFGGIVGVNDGWWSSPIKVVVPPTMRADLFEQVIQSIKDDDLSGAVDANGKKYKANKLHEATPVAVNGGYSFALGDVNSGSPQWLRGEDGLPFVLNIEAMRDVLGQRVPGAWQ